MLEDKGRGGVIRRRVDETNISCHPLPVPQFSSARWGIVSKMRYQSGGLFVHWCQLDVTFHVICPWRKFSQKWFVTDKIHMDIFTHWDFLLFCLISWFPYLLNSWFFKYFFLRFGLFFWMFLSFFLITLLTLRLQKKKRNAGIAGRKDPERRR